MVGNEHQATASCSWVPAHRSLLRGKKLGWRKMFACWVKTRRKWKGKQGLSSWEGQNKHQTTQSHHCSNVVLGRLRDGGMAPPHIHATTVQLSNCRAPSLDGGQLTEDNREERGLSLLFHHHHCKASACLQARRFLVLCQWKKKCTEGQKGGKLKIHPFPFQNTTHPTFLQEACAEFCSSL